MVQGGFGTEFNQKRKFSKIRVENINKFKYYKMLKINCFININFVYCYPFQKNINHLKKNKS